MILLVFILAVIAAVAVFLVRTRFWPLGPCPRCAERGGRGWGSTPDAYNRCRICGGSRERVRPLSLIWACHREEARRRREKQRSK